MSEADILRAITAWVNRDGRCRVKRNTVGFDERARAPYGLGKGSPDLVGITRGGRAIAIEVKSPTGRVSKFQAAWAKAFTAWGGKHCVARSLQDAINFVEAL